MNTEPTKSTTPKPFSKKLHPVLKFVSSPLFWAAFLLLGFSFPLIRNLTRSPVETIPVYAQLPDFQLTDQNSNAFQLSSHRGSVLVVNFIFTSCETSCPLLSAQMAKLQERVAGSGAAVKLISISVDPENDTVEVLKNYAAKYGSRPGRWFFLTGNIEQLESVVVGGFKMAMNNSEVDTLLQLTHSEKFVIVDQIGQIRGYTDLRNEADISEVLRKLTILLNTDPRLAPTLAR